MILTHTFKLDFHNPFVFTDPITGGFFLQAIKVPETVNLYNQKTNGLFNGRQFSLGVLPPLYNNGHKIELSYIKLLTHNWTYSNRKIGGWTISSPCLNIKCEIGYEVIS